MPKLPQLPQLPRPGGGFVKVWAWRLALTVIAPSAAGIVAWSLYVVAHDKYGVPSFLAALVSACFDGAALACLHLASEAVRENRSALGPRLATLLIAAISIYLNREHALMIDGGVPAIVLFAFPTVALLLLADLAWAATRTRHRAARGEQPMHWPVFGWLGWLLAREQAWDATKQRAVTHVTGQANTAPPVAPRGAGELLASELANMTPTRAVQLVHEARPELTEQQLVEVLAQYGQYVTATDVAIILGRVPQHAVQLSRADAPAPPPQQLVITVQQPEAIPAAPRPAASPPPTDNTQHETSPETGVPAGGKARQHTLDGVAPDRIIDAALADAGSSKAEAVRAASGVAPGMSAAEIARHLARNGIETDAAYVRTVKSRDRHPKKKTFAPEQPATQQQPSKEGTGLYL